MPPEANLEYSDDLLEGLELIWGKGFLSPGGSEEVTALLKGIAVEGQNVLDVGCGLGGPSCSLIEQHGAEHVTAIDIQEPIIRKAIELASARGLAELIDFRVVSPGPFPFDEKSFDLLFSKDAIVHVDDKPAFFRECYRRNGLSGSPSWEKVRRSVRVPLSASRISRKNSPRDLDG